jgi:hypothetical protein
LGVAGAICTREAILLDVRYAALLETYPVLAAEFTEAGMHGAVLGVLWAGCIGGVFLGGAAVMGLLLRGRFILGLVRKACMASWVIAWAYGMLILKGVAVVKEHDLQPGGAKPDSWNVAAWKLEFLWPVLLVAGALGGVYLFAWTRAAIRAWTCDPSADPAAGDRIIEDVRSHGPDPCFRKSVWSSVWALMFVVFILPLFLKGGCVENYRVPKGKGSPAVAVARVHKVQKKKPKKKLMVNPHSAISFDFPELDDSRVEQTVEQVSRVQYKADPSRLMAAADAMGAGGKGPGGWPDGMEDAKVRFIRLKYHGQGWDDGMDEVSRADINFLAKFKSLTPFKVATEGESHPIRLLRKYDPGYAPPFVYMTGSGGIDVSSKDMKILREYLHGGGMLFADCGSRQWDGAFRNFIRQVLPGQPLQTIPDDDILFQLPFGFQNGPPPLWHHGGYSSMGVKHNGRWVVFYHPGDVNDAWKENRSGMREDLAEGAMEIGVNVIYYSFSHYLQLTRKYRR